MPRPPTPACHCHCHHHTFAPHPSTSPHLTSPPALTSTPPPHRNKAQKEDEGQEADTSAVMSLLKYLQGMRGRRLWAYEDISLRQQELPSARALASLVNSFVAALAFERGLMGAWSSTALDWALYCRSRHLACRWGLAQGGGAV
jgi:hypothetical protein